MNSTAYSTPVAAPKEVLFQVLSRTALLTGILQLLAIVAQYYQPSNGNILYILKSLAIPVFGRNALNGGLLMVAWGLLLHFTLVFLITGCWFLTYSALPPRWRHWFSFTLMAGLSSGLLIVFLNSSYLPFQPHSQIPLYPLALVATPLITIGLPIALIGNRFYRVRKQDSQPG